jgi:hypothetical protein
MVLDLEYFYWLGGDLLMRVEMICLDREMLYCLGGEGCWGGGGEGGCLLTGKRLSVLWVKMVCLLLLVVGK